MYHRTSEKLITAPACEPISLAEALTHLRLDALDDAETVQSLITVARTTLEKWCWSAFITQTWQYWWDRFWWKMFIPRGPVAVGWNGTNNSGGVSFLNYLGPGAVSNGPSSYTSLPVSVWETSQENEIPFIRMAYLQTFPVTRGYRDDVTAQVVCGYGSTPECVPAPLRHAIKILLTHLYANRGEVPTQIPTAIDALIGPYRLKEF